MHPLHHAHIPRCYPRKQRGAVLMVMLVIVVLGFAAALISSLSSSALKISQQEKTAAALAQAKDALIGRAISDVNRPGELPCPDVDGDGKLTINIDFGPGTLCKQWIGYLPWKTLGLPELRDGENEKLWYAVSKNFYAGNTVALNSDTPGQLSISGLQNLNNIAAIIFAPGAPLCGKSQSTNNVDQYLEAMSSVTATSAVVYANSNDCNNSPYNDSLLAITADQIFQLAEKRIAREVKACLDEYANTPTTSPSNKYPWATPVSDTVGYTSTYNTFFGRLSTVPSKATSGTTNDPSMSTTWPPSCTLFTSSYWTSWRNLVFYQVANGYQPGGNATCTGVNCITLNSAGAYRAAVLVARRVIGTQIRTSPATDPPTPYLEGNNIHSSSTPTTTFETYSSSDPNYTTVNDLVLCLDGKNNCK